MDESIYWGTAKYLQDDVKWFMILGQIKYNRKRLSIRLLPFYRANDLWKFEKYLFHPYFWK